MNNMQYIVKNDTRYAMHVAVELCEQGDFDSVPEAFKWLMQERDDSEIGSGTCENSAKEWGEKSYYFVCSECGWNLANVRRVSIELAAEMIKTCPNCGRQVEQ